MAESLRTAMAMAVRFSAPRTTLRRGLPFRKHQPPCLTPRRPRWLHAATTRHSKPLPVVSSVQDAMAKPLTKTAGSSDLALDFTKRSHECGKLTEKDVGTRVRVCGWVASQRSHGAIAFVNLRDHTGIVQVPLDFLQELTAVIYGR